MCFVEIMIIFCLKDNYVYLLVCSEMCMMVVVDFFEVWFVLGVLEIVDVMFIVIWNIYYYWDYMGGNEELLWVYLELVVVGYVFDKGCIFG